MSYPFGSACMPASPTVGIGVMGLHTQEGKARLEQLLHFKDKLNVKIVVVSDADKTFKKWKDENLGKEVRFVNTLSEMLKVEGLHAVWITTPIEQRAKHVIETLEVGKFVICQPPFCTTSQEWQLIKALEAGSQRSRLMTADCGCGLPGPEIKNPDIVKYSVYSNVTMKEDEIEQDLLKTFFPMIHFALDLKDGFQQDDGTKMVPACVSVVHTIQPIKKDTEQQGNGQPKIVNFISVVLHFKCGTVMRMSHVLVPHRPIGVCFSVHAHQSDAKNQDMLMPHLMLATSPFEHLDHTRGAKTRLRALLDWEKAGTHGEKVTCDNHIKHNLDHIRDGVPDKDRHRLIEDMDQCFEVAFAVQQSHKLGKPVAFDDDGKVIE